MATVISDRVGGLTPSFHPRNGLLSTFGRGLNCAIHGCRVGVRTVAGFIDILATTRVPRLVIGNTILQCLCPIPRLHADNSASTIISPSGCRGTVSTLIRGNFIVAGGCCGITGVLCGNRRFRLRARLRDIGIRDGVCFSSFFNGVDRNRNFACGLGPLCRLLCIVARVTGRLGANNTKVEVVVSVSTFFHGCPSASVRGLLHRYRGLNLGRATLILVTLSGG